MFLDLHCFILGTSASAYQRLRIVRAYIQTALTSKTNKELDYDLIYRYIDKIFPGDSYALKTE